MHKVRSESGVGAPRQLTCLIETVRPFLGNDPESAGKICPSDGFPFLEYMAIRCEDITPVSAVFDEGSRQWMLGEGS